MAQEEDELIGKYKIERSFLERCRVERFGPTHGTNQLFGLLDLIEKFLTPESNVCEVGSYDGVSTSLFARICRRVTAVDQGRFNPCRPGLQDILLKYPNIRFVRQKTPAAAKLFHKGEFDAVYLDAAHDFVAVSQDIMAWRPLVRRGGIICGHDYISEEISQLPDFNWNTKALGHGGVKRAVDGCFFSDDIHLFKDSSWAVVLQ